jgi:dTDP-4-amino-4,6-dideoxygalactose transaminase
VIRIKERKTVQGHLKALGIASAVYYPLPLHLVEPYRDLGYGPGAFPEAERAAEETLAIPLFPEMTADQIEAVASGVRDALAVVGSRR